MNIIASTIKGVLSVVQSALTPVTPENTTIDTSPDPVSTIIKIALLLRTRLPADIVPIILDYAELWGTLAYATSLRPDLDKISEAQSPKLQIALTIPDHIPNNSIRRIRFTIVSRDQGWSSGNPADHNTYRGSYTWFEAGVRGLPRDGNNPLESDLERSDLTELSSLGDVFCMHRNALDEEHKLQCQPQIRYYKYGSRVLTHNLHAGRDFAEHTVEWSLDDPDLGIVNTFREIKRGCRIEVAAHARYPRWVNYVKSVRIEVEGTVVKRL